MKKVVRTIAVVALLMATSIGMANEPKLETVGTSKSLAFEWDAQFVDTSIKIEDRNGNTIYVDNITKVNTYVKKFDLSHLPEGDYFLKVENKMKEVVYSINVNATDVSILGEQENLKPIYRKVDGKVFMNLQNLDMNDVKVMVVDSENRILFAESFEEKSIVAKTFNFKNAIKDDYSVVVKDGEHTYYESILVK